MIGLKSSDSRPAAARARLHHDRDLRVFDDESSGDGDSVCSDDEDVPQDRRPQKRATETLRARIAARRQLEADAAARAAATAAAEEEEGEEDEEEEGVGNSIPRLPEGLQHALMAFAQVGTRNVLLPPW